MAIIHYPKDYRVNNIFMSVDNKVATKCSVWVDGETSPRAKFEGDDAYQDAMNFTFDLDYEMNF